MIPEVRCSSERFAMWLYAPRILNENTYTRRALFVNLFLFLHQPRSFQPRSLQSGLTARCSSERFAMWLYAPRILNEKTCTTRAFFNFPHFLFQWIHGVQGSQV